MAKKKAAKQQPSSDMAFELYRMLIGKIPEGTPMPDVYMAMVYMLADILTFARCDAMQSANTLDIIKNQVLQIMLRNKEMRNQVN